MTHKLLDDCFLHDKDRLRHEQALAILKGNLRAIAGTQSLDLNACTGRILAQELIAPRNIPFNDNAAVDGFAFCHKDYLANDGVLEVSARIPAGTVQPDKLLPATAARIFTGASMPNGADTVAMQEDCSLMENSRVKIPDGLKSGANCRKAGEDVKQSELIAGSGERLRAQDLAAIASTGINKIEIFDTLNLGILSNGDEILRPGDTFENGKVYDANHSMLHSLASSLPVSITDLGICPDDKPTTVEQINAATKNCDVILSTGGASRGEEDHLVDVVSELGTCEIWQLAIKPGRPMCFGVVNDTPCFILPGNPVAAFVCFQLYVRPALLVLGGSKWQVPARYPLPAAFSIRSKPDRREFLRGYLETTSTGKVMVQKFNRDGSGLISGLRQATGLIEIAEETENVASDDLVHFIPFSEFS